MSFEFGVFHEFPRNAGVTDAEAFTQSFAQVDAAERWGLDVIWIAELHFLPERSVASAPLLIASAIAGGSPPKRASICTRLQNTISTANERTETAISLRGGRMSCRDDNSRTSGPGMIFRIAASSSSARHSSMVWRLNQL